LELKNKHYYYVLRTYNWSELRLNLSLQYKKNKQKLFKIWQTTIKYDHEIPMECPGKNNFSPAADGSARLLFISECIVFSSSRRHDLCNNNNNNVTNGFVW